MTEPEGRPGTPAEFSGDPLKTPTLRGPDGESTGITSPHGEVIGQAEVSGSPLIPPTDWQARLAAAVEQTSRKKVSRRNERAELKRRRDYGLTQRHASKLARNNRSE